MSNVLSSEAKSVDFARNELKQPVVKSIFDFTAEALEQLAFWIEQRGLRIPITQLPGFSQFTADSATPIVTLEGTASAAYTNLATVGPTITGLSDGRYVVIFGASCQNTTAGNYARMGVKIDTTEAVDAESVYSANNQGSGCATAIVKTLSGSPVGGHTLLARYRASATTANFENRWLIAIRYANL